jgi:hypothetical protein
MPCSGSSRYRSTWTCCGQVTDMSKQFNPYHSWLGIPAEEQPPNHYRLLGIPLFETNEDVIQNGLDQRMAHIKSFANGRHGAVSQRLLTELSQAGVCLLRAEKKQVYDQQLRSKLRASAETVALQPAPVAAPSPLRQASEAPPRQTASARENAVPAAIIASQVSGLEGGKAAASGFPIVPTLVGSAIGLGVACVVLFVVSSWGASHVAKAPSEPGSDQTTVTAPTTPTAAPEPPEGENGEAESVVEPEPEAQPPEPAPEGPRQPKGSQPAPTEPGSPPTVPETQPAPSPFQVTNVPPPNWPSPLPGSPFVTQPAGTVPPTGDLPSTSGGRAPGYAAPGAPSAGTGTTKSIVLDLERSAMYVTLAEDAEGKEIQAQVQTITNLGTPYQLQPDEGIVHLRQSVDVELTQYAGVKIRLSMRMKGKNAELEVAPEIEAGGKNIDFAMKTLENASRSLRKKGVTVSNNLGTAQREILTIQNAMRQAAPAPVRTAQKQRITFLMQQQIPALQQQMTYLQSRDEVLRQLAVLVKQIHKKASINLLVQEVKPAG